MILLCRQMADSRGPIEPTVHVPVLLDAVLEALAPERGGFFVDATAGGGGHAEALLEASPDVSLLAVDRDAQAIARCRGRLERFGDRVHFAHAPFSALPGLVAEVHDGPVAGILADFGLSSDQLADRDRGFSFQEDGPLDMRMDRSAQKTSAAVLLAEASEDELEAWFRDYGEERFARRIANAIIKQRRFGPLLRTTQLAELVMRSIPRGRPSAIHPATRVFQALRIAVNRELDEIDVLLGASPGLLAPDGRLACISFHSLEDRLVKVAVRDEVRSSDFEDLLPRGVIPDPAEIRRNPRARSARLRAMRRKSS